MAVPVRHRPVHTGVRDQFNRPNVIYVTLCTKNRRPLIATELGHATIVSSWLRHGDFQVGRYVIMPDHIHFFCRPAASPPPPFAEWMRRWKSDSARKWPDPITTPLWQRDYWDRQLRHGENYTTKWSYVLQNPVRAGLVERAEDWPFQGELNVFEF